MVGGRAKYCIKKLLGKALGKAPDWPFIVGFEI
jgi:hypothetical protein